MSTSNSRDYILGRDEAMNLLTKDLGYESVDIVPTGCGNDYLTCLVRIAKGEFEGVPWTEVKKTVRSENEKQWLSELKERMRHELEN